MRKELEFSSKGLLCRGWLYLPDDLKENQKAPAVVMAHGFSALKEQVLPEYAERFTAAGFVTLVFDYRYFGESEGEPRSQLFPLEMAEDYRNAISRLYYQPEVDPDRIGIWGTSYSGGLVVYLGTHDKRVKAVVAQVPATFNPESRRAMDPERWDKVGQFLMQDRIERYKTGVVKYMKVVAPEGEPCVLPGKEAYDGYMEIKVPNWRNQITLESLEKIREFDPVSLVHMMDPTALLLIPAENDNLLPIATVKEIYEKAREPKAMKIQPITHFEIYKEPWLSKSANMAIDWYQKYL